MTSLISCTVTSLSHQFIKSGAEASAPTSFQTNLPPAGSPDVCGQELNSIWPLVECDGGELPEPGLTPESSPSQPYTTMHQRGAGLMTACLSHTDCGNKCTVAHGHTPLHIQPVHQCTAQVRSPAHTVSSVVIWEFNICQLRGVWWEVKKMKMLFHVPLTEEDPCWENPPVVSTDVSHISPYVCTPVCL